MQEDWFDAWWLCVFPSPHSCTFLHDILHRFVTGLGDRIFPALSCRPFVQCTGIWLDMSAYIMSTEFLDVAVVQLCQIWLHTYLASFYLATEMRTINNFLCVTPVTKCPYPFVWCLRPSGRNLGTLPGNNF